MRVVKLQCNYMDNPIGFDLDRPMLHWVVEAEGENRRQGAYRVQIARTPDFAEPVLDTGRVESDRSLGFRLEISLAPCARYFWRVNVWDGEGEETGFSDPAWFETGRYGRAWEADWIGGEAEHLQLRKGFRVEKPVAKATAYACGVGLYRLFVNGAPASDERLAPGVNAYDLWLQYQTYDVTGLINQGDNVVGAWLGKGFYMGRINWPGMETRTCIYGDRAGFILELDITYADGSRETLRTDDTWEAMASPYLRAELYDGEVFDARLYDPDWCRKTGDGPRARTVDIDKGKLQARRSVPVVAMRQMPVIRRFTTPAGELVLDFGQNMAGVLKLRLALAEGQEALFQFGESLDEKGNFYRDNMRTALEELRFIGDEKTHDYEECFTWHGFRYVKVTGAEVDAKDVTALVIHSRMDTTGRFECSDARVNQLFSNAQWSQRGNFVDNPTDCPQRDERLGWTGDAQVFCPTACMNMESDAFFRKYLYDLKLEQEKIGYVPVFVPFLLRGTGIWEFPTTGWGDAAVLMPWNLYLYYGDVPALEAQYDSMKAWVDYMTAQDTEGRHTYGGFHLGDWLAQDTKDPDNFFGLTPTGLCATAYYAWSAEHLSKAAAVLGKDGDAETYARLAEDVRAAFRREYVTEAGRVSSETQTAYLLALSMNMLRPDQRAKAAACLAERIRIDRVQLTTGFLGTPCLCPALTEAGCNEYAYALLLQDKCPGWLYEVSRGATTVWERWNSIRPDGTMGAVNMNSLNHYAFGAVCEWLYRYVAGLNPVEDAPGWRAARIYPRVNDQLSHARASIDTVHGTYASGWRLEGDRLTVTVEIPFNGHARVLLPDSEGCAVALNGAEAAPVAVEDGANAYHLGSGRWVFEYIPNFRTIRKRVIIDEAPRF